jgi:transcriptional regulator with XRE-family HTH domain
MPARAPPSPAHVAAKLAALGERIRERRKALKVSGVDAAEAAGMSRVTLQRIERGEPSVTMGAYLGAATAVGLELELVDPRERSRRGDGTGGKAPVPAQIRLADYPQPKKLACKLHQTPPTPEVALASSATGHVDTAAPRSGRARSHQRAAPIWRRRPRV